MRNTKEKESLTLAPAFAAWPTSFTHWARLAVMELDEHICPMAYCSQGDHKDPLS
jgi:predicted amidohydrolase